MNSRLTTSFIVVAFAFLASGCGDGAHVARPSTVAIDTSEGVGVTSKMTCVNVINFEYLDAAQLKENEKPLVPGNITTDNEIEDEGALPATKVTALLNKAEEEDVTNGEEQDADKEDVPGEEEPIDISAVKKCIRSEINQFKKCGNSCETYWGNRLRLLTRVKTSKKPAKSAVDIVEISSCKQVQEATCLVTN